MAIEDMGGTAGTINHIMNNDGVVESLHPEMALFPLSGVLRGLLPATDMKSVSA